jgi:predicted DNA-binding transcriptional regulator YafY
VETWSVFVMTPTVRSSADRNGPQTWQDGRVLDTSARLLRLLALLQAQRDWTGDAVAERLGVTPRTVRRDIDRLRRLGYPVEGMAGHGGGYRLGAGATLPPLLLDDDEAVAVAVGLRTSAGGSVAGIEESSARALIKLEQVLPAHLRRRVAALQAFTVPVGGAQTTVEAATLTTLAAACRDGDQLRFDYRSFDGSPSRRTVDPVRLVVTGRRWYLLAWDRDRDDWRTLRVDRIASTLAVGPRVPRREPPADVAAFVAQAVGAAAYRHRVRVRVAAPAAIIGDRIPPTSGWVEAIDDGSCRLVTGADSIDRMAGFLATLDHDFAVEEPDELRAALGRVAERLRRAATAT